jgi:hypothetical protein
MVMLINGYRTMEQGDQLIVVGERAFEEVHMVFKAFSPETNIQARTHSNIRSLRSLSRSWWSPVLFSI